MKTLRIAVWNLERPTSRASARKDRQIDKMREIDADIWLLTETHESIRLEGYSAVVSKPAPGYHRKGEMSSAILSRYPIRGPLPVFDPEFAVCAEIEVGKIPLLVYASVIPYADYRGRDGKSARWEEHRKHVGFNGTDWRSLRREHPTHEFIAGGDFNQCLDGSGWYGNAESERLLNDAMKGAGLACATTENFRNAPNPISRSSIDHICLSSGLAALSPKAVAWDGGVKGDASRLSDHNGVVVTLQLP